MTERTPIAFVQVRGRIELADADGVLLTMTPRQMAARHYSFPVVSGIDPQLTHSPFAARACTSIRDSSPTWTRPANTISAQLSEVDLSDPE